MSLNRTASGFGEFRKYSSGKSFFRRANRIVRRKSFFWGLGFSIFVSATKEIQSWTTKKSKIRKPDPKSLKTKTWSKIQKTNLNSWKAKQKNPRSCEKIIPIPCKDQYVEKPDKDFFRRRKGRFFYAMNWMEASSLPTWRTPFNILLVWLEDGFFIPLIYWASKLWFIPILSDRAFALITL